MNTPDPRLALFINVERLYERVPPLSAMATGGLVDQMMAIAAADGEIPLEWSDVFFYRPDPCDA